MSLCTICTKERNQTIAYIIPTESPESMKSMCYYIYIYNYVYVYIYLKKTIMDQTSWYSSCVRLMCSNIACFILCDHFSH